MAPRHANAVDADHAARTGPAPLGAPDPLARSFTYRLHQLHKLTDQDSQACYQQVLGLSLSDHRCLTTIGAFEPLSVRDLAQRANLDKSQASRAAQALVGQELVLKQDSDQDGRGVVLRLSPAGRRLCDRALALVQQRNQQILCCLSADEQALLSSLLDRLIAHQHAAEPAPDARPTRPARSRRSPSPNGQTKAHPPGDTHVR